MCTLLLVCLSLIGCEVERAGGAVETVGACVSGTCDEDEGAPDTGAHTDTGTDTGADADSGGDSQPADPDTGADYIAASGLTMIRLSAGTFSMGGGMGDPDGYYVDHPVTLTRDFYISMTEVTRGQWEARPASAGWVYSSMPSYPCTGSPAACPADTLSWYDAASYANWLSDEEGLERCYLPDATDVAVAYASDPSACVGYRLPTEAEWEYAARAGEDTTYSGSNTSGAVAWTNENAYSVGTYAHEVATLSANAWGIYDMSGNVSEWTNDWHELEYGGYSSGASEADPPGPATGEARVHRGGAWGPSASYAQVCARQSYPPNRITNTSSLGFRLVRSSIP